MKLIPFVIIAFCLAIPATPALAQTRLVTIDLRKVFDDYYKTKEADASLKDEAGELDRERKALVDMYEKASEEYQQAMEQANNQAISADERERRKKTAETRLLRLKDLEGSITQFDRQARSTLEEKQRRMRESILSEIRSTVNDLAKTQGFDLVIDTAAETINKTPVVLFSTGSNDITTQVLGRLNAGAPVGGPNTGGGGSALNPLLRPLPGQTLPGR